VPKKEPSEKATTIIKSKLITLAIKKISEIKFIVGGAEILEAHNKKNIKVKTEEIKIKPLFK
jgi:hypothetical protein